MIRVHKVAIMRTSTNVLWIRNCSTYSEPITSHALGWVAGSRRTLLRRADVMAATLKECCQIRTPTPSIDAYLLEEQSCQISSRSYLKRRSLRLFLNSVAATITRRRTRWEAIWTSPDPKSQDVDILNGANRGSGGRNALVILEGKIKGKKAKGRPKRMWFDRWRHQAMTMVKLNDEVLRIVSLGGP